MEERNGGKPDGTEHFVFILVEDFSHLAFSCAIEPLRIANLLSGEDLYRWSFISANGRNAVCSNGSVTLVDGDLDAVPKCDRLFVVSGIHMNRHVTARLLGALRRERSKGVPIAGLCSGAYILAKAGFLDGRRAAIHWEFHDSFAEEFPQVDLVHGVFVADGKFITASGGTATADLMLHLIEARHGNDLSVAVADQMVYSPVRHATAAQRVSLQSRKGIRNRHLVCAVQLMQMSIDSPLSMVRIAEEVGVTRRQLERLFDRFLNRSPKKYYMEMRLNRARHLLVQTEKSVTDVAIACGFNSASHFSRVYRDAFGAAPSVQRDKLF